MPSQTRYTAPAIFTAVNAVAEAASTRGEADHGRRDVDHASGRDAERRDDARATAALDALRDDVEDGRPGDDRERERRASAKTRKAPRSGISGSAPRRAAGRRG